MVHFLIMINSAWFWWNKIRTDSCKQQTKRKKKHFFSLDFLVAHQSDMNSKLVDLTDCDTHSTVDYRNQSHGNIDDAVDVHHEEEIENLLTQIDIKRVETKENDDIIVKLLQQKQSIEQQLEKINNRQRILEADIKQLADREKQLQFQRDRFDNAKFTNSNQNNGQDAVKEIIIMIV